LQAPRPALTHFLRRLLCGVQATSVAPYFPASPVSIPVPLIAFYIPVSSKLRALISVAPDPGGYGFSGKMLCQHFKQPAGESLFELFQAAQAEDEGNGQGIGAPFSVPFVKAIPHDVMGLHLTGTD
jgi:hypothetical protein